MKTLLYILANGIYAFLTLSIFLGYFALKHYSYTISDNGEDINLLGKVIFIATCIIAIIMSIPIGIFAYRNFDEVCKHSKKCTFYTLRFGCSFAAVNTIKPQLL